MHFACPSFRNSSCPPYSVRMHWWITILLGTNVVLIETMCSDLNPDP